MTMELLLVTFDLHEPVPGDPRYKRVDELLKSKGAVERLFKQVRLVETTTKPTKLARAISAVVGPESGVLVASASRPYRFVIGNQHRDAKQRARIAALFRERT